MVGGVCGCPGRDGVGCAGGCAFGVCKLESLFFFAFAFSAFAFFFASCFAFFVSLFCSADWAIAFWPLKPRANRTPAAAHNRHVFRISMSPLVRLCPEGSVSRGLSLL